MQFEKTYESNTWDKFWLNQEIDPILIKRKLDSSVFSLLKKEIGYNFNEIKNLKIVELGSGMGVNSLLFAMYGAEITLIDNNRVALLKAKELFNYYGLDPKMINKSIFDLDKDLIETYDVAFSFGLAEHFKNYDRCLVIKAHSDLIHKGGLFIVSVPNKYCPMYQIWMNILKIFNRWNVGYEEPYSRRELSNIARDLSINNFKVCGVNFLKSIDDHTLFFLKYPIQKAIQKGRYTPVQLMPDYRLPIFDDFLGYALWGIGRK